MKTQVQIAKELGLSFRTVSRCLNKSGYVSPATRKKIDQYIGKHNYRPNRMARSLVLRKSQLIGILAPSLKNSYYPEIIEIINAAVKGHGYHLLLSVSEEDPVTEKEELEILLSVPVDGIIWSPTSSLGSRENGRMLAARKIPHVLIDRYYKNSPCSFVATDSKRYAKELVEYLLAMGHREIALAGGPRSNSFANDIYAGYAAALKGAGIKLNPELVFAGPITEKHGYETAEKIFARAERPSVIQAVNDEVALGVYKAAEKYKLRIPEDISVAGFSDLGPSSLLNPPLTTVKENTVAMGLKAAAILLDLIEGQPVKKRKVLLAAELVIRKSVKKIE